MKNTYLMGMDLGTSSLKTIIIDYHGRIIAHASKEYDTLSPLPGWAEQDPHAWIQAALDTMRSTLKAAHIDPTRIASIGLSGQMHGMACLDESGEPLRPAIIWADQRSASQVEGVKQAIGSQRLGQWTGNPVATGFMLPSWLWVLENEPEVARKTRTLLLPKDYLRFHLSGRIGTEPSDASSTLLFDPAQRRWSTPLLDRLGISPNLLPPVGDSSTVAGGLTREAACACGLREGTPVVYGGGDQAMQALGNGIIEPGWLSCTIGTGGQLLVPTRSPVYDQKLRLHSFCHALPERWYLMAATLSAGLSLKWLRDNIFMGSSYQELADLAHQVGDSEGAIFLPHLAGERTPYMDPASKACFWGLTLRHNRGHIIRAVMEGVIFSLREGLDLILDLGVEVERVIASGGGTNHPLWLQLIADVFNRPVYQTHSFEAAAMGAAILAGVGIGVYPDVKTACQQVVRWSDQIVIPNPGSHALKEIKYSQFLQLYPAAKQIQIQ